jgi:L-amino acid N-acyltransferase YncA
MIRFVLPADAASLCAIYNYYIENTVVTFEEQSVTEQEMCERINAASKVHPWLVFELEGEVVGYAYVSEWKSRYAYRFSLETSVYLSPSQQGNGIGTRLYQCLIEELKKTHCHSLIAGISLPNAASIALHEKLDFEKIGHFKEVGWKFGQWVDVGYWECILPSDDPLSQKLSK